MSQLFTKQPSAALPFHILPVNTLRRRRLIASEWIFKPLYMGLVHGTIQKHKASSISRLACTQQPLVMINCTFPTTSNRGQCKSPCEVVDYYDQNMLSGVCSAAVWICNAAALITQRRHFSFNLPSHRIASFAVAQTENYCARRLFKARTWLQRRARAFCLRFLRRAFLGREKERLNMNMNM